MQPLVSIIIPVYNVEKYLTQCLDSVIKQEFTNFECILVDDGSSDSSPAICDEYAAKDSRIKVIHQENKGVSAARNAGLDIVIGKYIMFLDGDDLIKPSMLSIMKGIAESTRSDIVFSGFVFQYLTSSYEVIDFFNSTLERSQFFSFFEKGRLIDKYTFLFHSVWGKIFRRDFIGSVRFDTDIKWGEDYLFCLKLYEKIEAVHFVPESLYIYNVNGDSVCSNYSVERMCNELEVVKRTQDFYKKNGMNTKYACQFANEHIHMFFVLYYKNGGDWKDLKKIPKCLLKSVSIIFDFKSKKSYIWSVLIKNRLYFFAYILFKLNIVNKILLKFRNL